jgi:hypothetical protein
MLSWSVCNSCVYHDHPNMVFPMKCAFIVPGRLSNSLVHSYCTIRVFLCLLSASCQIARSVRCYRPLNDFKLRLAPLRPHVLSSFCDSCADSFPTLEHTRIHIPFVIPIFSCTWIEGFDCVIDRAAELCARFAVLT